MKLTAHLSSIGKWAVSLPAHAWKPGPPGVVAGAYVAVRTTTGKILTGKSRAFRPASLRLIASMPKYGPVVAWVEVGD